MPKLRNIVVNANSIRTVLENHESVSSRLVKEVTGDAVEQAMLVAGVNNAILEILDHERDPAVLSSPPSAIASQLQTFLAERAVAENKAKARTLPGGAEEAKFDSGDWLGWAASFFTWIGRLDKAKWLTAPAEPAAMPADARVAMLGDWGTGLYGAPACARCIGTTVPAFTHVIHLGDVYYSGTQDEIKERFLAVWPNISGATSLACNANHEMYSGGRGYFETVLPVLRQAASYFALENDQWLLVGLDTAYKDHSLNREQLGWLYNLLHDARRSNKKLVLLSHHQPYSLMETQGPNIISFVRQLLEAGRIHAWYWGHEHRCVIYDQHPTWRVKGRCIGFSGYPYFRDTAELKGRNGKPTQGANGSTWYRLDGLSLSADVSRVPGGLKIPGSAVLDGPNPYLDEEAENYGPHGYVALEFEGDRLFETYYVPSEPGPEPVEVVARQEV